MTNQEAINALNALSKDGDNEEDHYQADRVLLEVLDSHGLKDVADAYRAARERVGFWYA